MARRLAELEAQVLAGTRKASSLHLFPRDVVKTATLKFAKDPYGPPEPF